MVDRIKPLKIESSDTGGTDNDTFPTSTNINQDFIDARGLIIQNATSDDEVVKLAKDASNNLTFNDGVVSGTKTLTNLLSWEDHFPATQAVYVDGNRVDAYTEDGSIRYPWKTIASALSDITDSAPSKRYSVLIASGNYVENVVAKSYVSLVGADPLTTRIAPTSGVTLTLGNAVSHISNLNLYGSYGIATADNKAVHVTDGLHFIENCWITSAKAEGDYNLTALQMDAGNITIKDSRIITSSTSTAAGGIKYIRGVYISAPIAGLYIHDTLFDTDVIGDNNDYGFAIMSQDGSPDICQLHNCQIDIDSSDSAIGFYQVDGAAGSGMSFFGCHFDIYTPEVAPCYAFYIDSAGAGSTVKSYGNSYKVVGGGSTYIAAVDTGDTFISIGDKYDAGTTPLIGSGTFHITSSDNDGDWYVSGNLTDGTNNLTVANAKTAYDHSQVISGNPHDLGHTDLTSGIGTTTHADIDTHITSVDDLFQVGQAQPMGFPNRTDSILSYNPTTQTVSIEPTSGSFDYYRSGIKYTVSSLQSKIHSNAATDIFFFYWDSTNTLQLTTTPWNLMTDVPISVLYYNTITDDGFHIEERHGSGRNVHSHQIFHDTIGTYWTSVDGLGLGGYTLQPGTPVDGDNNWTISSGVIHDEDIASTISATVGVTYKVFYRSGAAGDWTYDTNNLPLLDSGTYLQWNEWTGATWQKTTAATNNYINHYVFIVPSNVTVFQVITIVGQAVHTSLTAAEAETVADLNTSGGFIGQEFLAAYKITLSTNASYTSEGMCRVEAVEDTRTLTARQVTTGAGIDSHNSLNGLQGGGAGEYYHFTATQHTDLTDAGDSTLHYHSADRARAVHTGTQAASTISDFDDEVGNHTDVSANTTHRTSDGTDHDYINQDVTTTGTPSFSTATATTLLGDLDTNVAAAGVTVSGTTLAADGTDTNIDISLLAKGEAGIVLTNITGSAPAVTTNKLYSLNGILTFDTVSLEGAGAGESPIKAVVQATHGLSVGNAIRHNGTIWVKAQADSVANAETVGIVSEVPDTGNFTYRWAGLLTSGTWTDGETYFLSPDIAGDIITEPTWANGEVRVFCGTGTPDGLLIDVDLGDEITDVGAGEANIGSNAGSGISVWYQKSGVDLQFNAIKSENDRLSVALDGVTHDVELTINEGNIVHDNLSGSGTTNTHSDIDTHLDGNGADHADVASNTTHRTSTGIDHSYIDQDITKSATPIFVGINLDDTDSIYNLKLQSTSTITTADKTLTIDVNDSNRTLTISGDATITGSNTGDQTTIVGITGTKAEFDTACSEGSFAYSGGAFHDGFSDSIAGEHFLQTAITNVDTTLATGLLKVTTGTGALSSITDSSSNWDTAYAHVSNDGTHHSFISQDVTSTGTPTFSTTQITNYIDIPEQTTPGNPVADTGRIYVADDGGTTTLYFRDNAGTETDLLAGGGGDHASTHEDTGGDEISVAGLSGKLADLQDPDIMAQTTLSSPASGDFIVYADITDSNNLKKSAWVNFPGLFFGFHYDNNLTIVDFDDTSAGFDYECGLITTGTTRTITMIDEDLTLVGLTNTQTLAGKTLTTPTIGDFQNATHDHLNAAGGGTITAAAVSDFDTEVGNHTDVDANTTHRTSTGADHSYIGQNVTATGTPSFTSVTATTINGTTFDTNIAAAGVTLSGTTLSADGTNTNIDITITPKGAAGIVLPNAGSAPGTTTSKLYQTGSVLYFDGVSLEAGDAPLYDIGTRSIDTTINFANGVAQTMSATGDFTVDCTGQAAGRTRLTVVNILASAAARTITFDTGWLWAGKPASDQIIITSGATAQLVLQSFGTTVTAAIEELET